ncbi:response regulator [Heliobacillus mobilis]|uniref:Stage 0 sporulation protein A homolog n=1 Tax=Heliobacterium mobile TaxID=28064 RepID=A0A6I3SJ14_HELMO|nr:response regulator transcription factor [Heliobacterium mobile]MTV48775.1 response regulator [Heliobacterium mobile]
MALIYVADDEPPILDLITRYLLKDGFDVQGYTNGKDILDAYRQRKPDLIILDIMMPGVDGLEICKIIRRESDIPIIIVSAKDDEIDRIVGLELGSDDYLSKPFSPRELVVRVKNILRRVTLSSEHSSASVTTPVAVQTRSVQPTSEHSLHIPSNATADAYGQQEVSQGTSSRTSDADALPHVLCHDLQVWPEARKVSSPKGDLDLTAKEYELLCFLITNRKKAYTRDQLLNQVWGYTYTGSPRTIDDLIKRLRKKLVHGGSSLEIKTVWGYGYIIED